MNGKKALEKVIEAVKKHHRKNPSSKTSKIEIHWDFAYDLAKLGRTELGELSDKIWKDGLIALEKNGLFGLKVIINYEKEGSKVKVS